MPTGVYKCRPERNHLKKSEKIQKSLKFKHSSIKVSGKLAVGC